jgi:hypothetical protein
MGAVLLPFIASTAGAIELDPEDEGGYQHDAACPRILLIT